MTDSTDILWLELADSTNSEVRRRLAELDNLSVIAAEFQTAGRGQGDHTWTSERKENLTFTVLLKFAPSFLLARDMILISCITALAICHFLESKAIESRIKWPNDIYVANNKKICGILIENIISDHSVSASIIGIGLNVNQTVFPNSLPNPVSLSLLTGNKYDTHLLLEEFVPYMKDALRHLDSDEGRDYLKKEFENRVFTLPSTQL